MSWDIEIKNYSRICFFVLIICINFGFNLQKKSSSSIWTNCMKGKNMGIQFLRKASEEQHKGWNWFDITCVILSLQHPPNKKVFLSFIDDYTKKTWICFLLGKSEVFHYFIRCFRLTTTSLCMWKIDITWITYCIDFIDLYFWNWVRIFFYWFSNSCVFFTIK
jgi:hypothetical protein